MLSLLFYGGVAVGLLGVIGMEYFGRKGKLTDEEKAKIVEGFKNNRSTPVGYAFLEDGVKHFNYVTECNDGKCLCYKGKRYELTPTDCGKGIRIPEGYSVRLFKYGEEPLGATMLNNERKYVCLDGIHDNGWCDVTTDDDKAKGQSRHKSCDDGREVIVPVNGKWSEPTQGGSNV